MDINCPVCQEDMTIKKSTEGKVLTCPGCDSSLFISKILPKEVKIMPFEIQELSSDDLDEDEIDDESEMDELEDEDE